MRNRAALVRIAAVLSLAALVVGPHAGAGPLHRSPAQANGVLAADPSGQPGTATPSATPSIRPSKPAAKRPAASNSANPTDISVQWAGDGALGIPSIVLAAYQQAAIKVATTDPGCHLGWWVLAGIGHIESGHAEGGRVDAHGTTLGRILGPRLDGHLAGNAIIRDTDHGVLDGDPVYDRAIGPMQFIPSTWRQWGVDGNGDGVADPNNVFDATLTAGHYLCAGGRDLATATGLRAAILSYNNSDSYLATVLAWAQAYRVGAVAVAGSSAPVVTDVTAVRPPLSARPPLILVVRPTPSGSATPPHSAPGHPSPTAPRPSPSASSSVPPSAGSAGASASCPPTSVSPSAPGSPSNPSGASSSATVPSSAASSGSGTPSATPTPSTSPSQTSHCT